MPALGTHMTMDAEEKEKMFAIVVPDEDFLILAPGVKVFGK